MAFDKSHRARTAVDPCIRYPTTGLPLDFPRITSAITEKIQAADMSQTKIVAIHQSIQLSPPSLLIVLLKIKKGSRKWFENQKWCRVTYNLNIS
jgi:hypothetical protein